MNKEQFHWCLDDLLRSFAGYEHEEGLPQAPDGRHHLKIDHTNFGAMLTALRWSLQNIEDFEPRTYCIMCGTPLSTTERNNALCDYHVRLQTSGLVCVWGYEDDDGWEFYCGERVFNDGLCEHHYTRKQKESSEALEAEQALKQVRPEEEKL